MPSSDTSISIFSQMNFLLRMTNILDGSGISSVTSFTVTWLWQSTTTSPNRSLSDESGLRNDQIPMEGSASSDSEAVSAQSLG